MSVTSLVFGSYMARCRSLVARGKSFAEGLSDPSLQKAGLSLGRTLDVNHTRPSSSNIGLCTLALLFQIASSPQYGESASGFPAAKGVFGSRTDTSTLLDVWRTGSRTGRESALASAAP